MMRNCCYRSRSFEVGIVKISRRLSVITITITVAVPITIVIIVRDVGNIRDAGVGYVHSLKIIAAAAVPGNEWLAVAKRAPAVSTSERNPDAEVAASEPRDERGSIHRPHIDRAGHPRPIATAVDPTTVMERGETPWSVIDPGPSPGTDPYPPAVVIWRPARRDHHRHPNRAVGGKHAPIAVVVEVFIADKAGRNIARGNGMIFAAVAHAAPVIETIERRRFINFMRQRSSTSESCSYVRTHPHGGAVPGCVTLAL